MKTIPNIDVISYIQANINILKYFTYWPPNSNKKIINTFWYVYYVIFISLIMILFNVIEYVNFTLAFGNLEKMIEISFLLFTNTTQISKIAIFIYNSKNVQESVTLMNNQIFQPKTIEHYNILKKQMDVFYIVWKVYMIICAATCSLWALFPFVDNTVKDKGLPFDYHYPYDRSGTVAYPLTFLYQSLGMFIHGTSHAALDSLYAGMMAFVGAQIDILNHTLENLHEMGNLGGYKGFESAGKSKRMDYNLVYCIHRHWNILKFVDKLNGYIAFTTLIQFGMAGIILCVAMYSMSMLPPTSGKFASDFFYFMAMVTQLSVYCWYGNEIMIKSDNLSASIYKCDWTDTHLTFKKNILLFTLFVARSSKIFAGYFITLSLNTFGGILRASWSYFAVLKNVQE